MASKVQALALRVDALTLALRFLQWPHHCQKCCLNPHNRLPDTLRSLQRSLNPRRWIEGNRFAERHGKERAWKGGKWKWKKGTPSPPSKHKACNSGSAPATFLCFNEWRYSSVSLDTSVSLGFINLFCGKLQAVSKDK